MKKSILFLAMLAISTILFAQNEQPVQEKAKKPGEGRDWSIGVSLGLTQHYYSEIGRETFSTNRFYANFIGVSTSYKGFTANFYIPSFSDDRLVLNQKPYKDAFNRLPFLEKSRFNIGYQYTTNLYKPSHKLSTVYGAYLGLDNLEIAFGVESKYVRVMGSMMLPSQWGYSGYNGIGAFLRSQFKF